MFHPDLAKTPSPIAVTWKAYQNEPPSFRKLLRLVDAYEALLKYCAVIAIQNFYAASLADAFPETDRLIRERIMRPSLGHWAELLREVMRCFAQLPSDLFAIELLKFQRCLEREKEAKEAFNRLHRLRNEYVGHGAVLPDEDAAILVRQHEKDLQTLLERASFLKGLPLLFVEAQMGKGQFQVKPLMGTEYLQAPSQTVTLPTNCPPLSIGHVVIQNPETGTFLDLHPLMLYAECVETIGNKKCLQRKVMFFNELRDDQQRIAFLDYWQGHHSRFRSPNPLPDEFRRSFPKPERPAGKADWFENFVQELTAYFVGRGEELEALCRFVEQSPKKVLVVIGAPGMGKSALLARWADEHQAIRHFLREGDANTYEPIAVFRNLAMQMSEKFGIAWQAPDQPDPAAYRSAFDQTLKEATKKGQVILVIDGLDESVRAQVRGKSMEAVQTIVDWLPEPAFLPEGARIILSTRPELLEHRSFAAKFGQDKAEHMQLGKMNDADVRALLYQVKSKYEVLSNQAYVEAIVERSEGNPLYLRMLLEDIAEGRIAFGNIEQLPKGAVAYFGRILEFIEGEGRIREMPDAEVVLQAKREAWEALVAQGILKQEQVEAMMERERAAMEGRAGVRSVSLLALYCLVKEPISVKEAAKMLEADEEETHRAFGVIRTVLVGDGEGRFAIFHSAFRDYFLNLGEYTEDHIHRHERTIEQVQQKLLDYCSRWQDHKSHYALRHYAEHLLEAKQYEALFELARDEVFYRVQQATFVHDPNLPLATVQMALRGAAETDDAGAMAKFLLTHAHRLIDIERESPLEALRRTGNIERAWALADLYEIERCILWHLLLAWELKDEGKLGEAQTTLRRLLEKQLPHPSPLGWVANYFAEILAQSWDVDENVSTVLFQEMLPKETYKILCKHLAVQGLFAAALSIANQIKGEERWWALRDIAIAQAQTGDFDAALETTSYINVTRDSSDIAAFSAIGAENSAIEEIVRMQAEAGRYSDALRTVTRIHPWFQAPALVHIVDAQAKAGDFEGAFKTVELIERSMRQCVQGGGDLEVEVLEKLVEPLVGLPRQKALQKIGIAQAEAKKFPDAFETTQKIWEPIMKRSVLEAIAIAQVRDGEYETALKTARSINDEGLLARILREIAVTQARFGKFTEAIQTTEMIEDLIERAWSLVFIIELQVQKGNWHEAGKSFIKALQIVTNIEDIVDKIWLLVNLVILSQKIKQHKLEKVPNKKWWQRLLEKLRLIKTEMSRDKLQVTFDTVIETALGIEDRVQGVKTLIDIAKAAAEESEEASQALFQGALKLANGKTKALQDIAIALGELGKFDASIEVAQSIRHESDRMETFQAIAAMQMRLGERKTARTTFAIALHGLIPLGKFLNPEQVKALSIIAMVLACSRRQEQAKALFATCIQMAQLIPDLEEHIETMKTVAIMQAEAGDFAAALETVRSIKLKGSFIWEDMIVQRNALDNVLEAIAIVQTKERRFDDAVKTAQKIGWEYARCRTLKVIAIKQAQARDFETAIRTAREIENARWKAEALAGIAQMLVQVGKKQTALEIITNALKTAELIEDEGLRAEAIAAVAIVQAKAGDFENAFKSAQMIIDAECLVKALSSIAVMQTKEEDQLTTILTACEIAERGALDSIEPPSFERPLELDLPYLGKVTVRGTTALRAQMLAMIAESCAKIDRKLAEALFEYAADSTAGLFDFSKARVLTSIAIAEVRSGFCDWAIRIAETTSTDTERNRHLPEIATALVEAGDKENFKRLLIPCAYYLDAAYRMCGLLARLYPEQATAIAQAVQAY